MSACLLASSRLRRAIFGWLLAALLGGGAPQGGRAQTNDAVSREVSVFNFGQSTAVAEAVSREVSVFNFGQSSAVVEAVSREVSLFNFGQPTGQGEAVSREVSVFNSGGASATIEAISREVSVWNRGSNLLDAISREVSVFVFGLPSARQEGISREVSLYNHGFNRLTLSVGETVVPAGTSGSVPLTLATLAPVTNVQVAVDFPGSKLTNWTVQPQPPLSAGILVSNDSRLLLTFTPPPGQPITRTQELGQISFLSVSNQPSAFLPLPAVGVTAPMPDGMAYTPYKRLVAGEVVVLNGHSLLRPQWDTNHQEYLKLYGYSGTDYTIESATDLRPPVWWTPMFALTPVDYIARTPALARTNGVIFYRARE